MIDFVFYFFAFALGLIFGSFLNVYIIRFNTGHNLSGNSACYSCGKPLGFFELVPLFSYLFLGAKCKKCGSRISFQYPLVEFSLGVLFFAIFYKFGFAPELLPLFALAFLSVFVVVYDFRHKLIPQKILNFIYLSSFLFVAISLFKVPLLEFAKNILLSELIYFAPIFAMWFFSKGKAMGLGDVKLSLALAVFLSPALAYSAFVLQFVLGAAYIAMFQVYNYLKGKELFSMSDKLAFAPFIIFAFWIVFLLDLNVFELFLI